ARARRGPASRRDPAESSANAPRSDARVPRRPAWVRSCERWLTFATRIAKSPRIPAKLRKTRAACAAPARVRSAGVGHRHVGVAVVGPRRRVVELLQDEDALRILADRTGGRRSVDVRRARAVQELLARVVRVGALVRTADRIARVVRDVEG